MAGAVGANDILSERYLLKRELGRGGMGVVFLARDLKHGREVAIKLLAIDATHLVGSDRFLAEIRIAARLNHPNILALHDSGEHNGRLYYVMPYVQGESLRQRLDRERWLSLTDALRIARSVADALSYAHARGVVHRDVKPDNILLDRAAHASLADFGLARALSAAGTTQRTAAGLAIGSPAYMSPEQCGGEAHMVDGRSDVYALGCVVFEMLAGEPPFTGGSAQEVLARHLTEQPPSLRMLRADVPPALDAAVGVALAKLPHKRHATVEAFACALENAAGLRNTSAALGWRSSTAARLAIAGAAAVGIALLGYLQARSLLLRNPVAQLDSMRFVVFPLRNNAEASPTAREEALLHDAFARWRELEIVDRLQVGDALTRAGRADVSTAEALSIARDLGAGRYVHGVTTVVGDSVQFNVALYDAIAAGRPLRRASIRVATGSDPPDSLFALLADSMLFGRVTWEERPRADIGTASLFARLQYGAGHEALQVWNLAKAESLFSAAATHDPDFARAQLWLAQVRNWSGHGPRTWGVPAERALRAPGALGPREHHLASGLVFLAGGQFRDACRIYDVLRERDPRDFAAWYGRGECHARDDVVVRDSTAPSGWSFRSSYHQAVEAYQRAFEVLPLSHRGFSSGAYERVRSIFVTRPNGFRWGTAGAGNTERFIGWPVWQSDTLAFLPYPWAPGRAESPRPAAAIRELAIVQHRRAFYALANGWANAFPSNAEAAFAVAVSLEMMGDPAALDALRRARRLPAEPSLRLRLAASEVWVRVKFAVPHNPADLTGAAALADSLINATVPSNADEALILAELAGLIGRPAAAAQLARRAARADADAVFVPAPLVGISNALLAFAAAGAPNDSIIRLEREAEEIIRKTIPRADRPAVRALHIERAAILAFPAHNFAILNDSAALQSPLAIAQGAWVNGDTASAGRRVSELREALDASEMTLDMLYPTAYLLALLGDTAVAISSLAAGLEALRGVDPGVLDEMGRAGVLARSMALLATLSAATGDDRSARRWAAAVVNLLGHAESWPGMPVDRLRRLTNAPEPLTVLEKQ